MWYFLRSQEPHASPRDLTPVLPSPPSFEFAYLGLQCFLFLLFDILGFRIILI
jgi:hypothetical protein